MKIAGLWNNHDCSFCVLEDGKPIVHAELERYIREKEPKGDSFKLFKEVLPDTEIDEWITAEGCFDKEEGTLDEPYYTIGHHQAHAANAFYSSNLDESLIITLDGGGIDQGNWTATTIWKGQGNKLYPYKIIPKDQLNIGNIWSRVTEQVFGLSTGHPRGHSAGTVMAVTCLGDKNRYYNEFSSNPYGFCDSWHLRNEKDDEQSRYDVAAALQEWTETKIREVITYALEWYPTKNLCLAGGVALNCVMTTKLYDWFDFENIYVTPTPHDGGLCIGAAQFLWHHELDNPRIKWEDDFTPYLGQLYSKDIVLDTLKKYDSKIVVNGATDDDVLQLLDEQNIISVFGGGSESGRRALGNRSILADPRSPKMKDMINKKVKHRQWFRPFAPSILREEVKNWFQKDIESPYMNFAVPFKPEMKEKVPAVSHLDGTGRIQTVTENNNKWYYNFIKKWFNISGVPIVLNTSFNDREPIVETPEDAIKCYLKTNIDYLYFYEFDLLIKKKV
jgi:carbamoyltransferase